VQHPRSYLSIRLVATSFLVGASLLITHPAFAAGPRADYVEVAAWDTGYQAQYTVANDGPGTMATWTVAFDLPASDSISSSWDSVLVRSGPHLVFSNAAWNGALTPGTFTTFGFVVVGTTRPANCTINGGPCDTLPAFAGVSRSRVSPGRGDRALPRWDHGIAACTDPRSRRSRSVWSRRRSRARTRARR
jgi:hypothetical protein